MSSPSPPLVDLSSPFPSPDIATELELLTSYVKNYPKHIPTLPTLEDFSSSSDPSSSPLPPSSSSIPDQKSKSFYNSVFPTSLYRVNESLRPSPYGGYYPTHEFYPHVYRGGPIDKDCYGNGAFLSSFESHIATLLNKSHGMFNMTGVLSQLIACRIHCKERSVIGCHPQSHLVLHELDGPHSVFNLSTCLLGRTNTILTYQDVVDSVARYWKTPSVIVIELPERENGGASPTWSDLLKIREYCTHKGIKMHLDGARIWEIQPFYDRSFSEIGELFDSVYVSFYKGLNNMTGAMLLGDKEFIEEAKRWQRRLGGNTFSYYPYVISAERGFNININTFGLRYEKMKTVVEALTKVEKAINPIPWHECSSPDSLSIYNHRAKTRLYWFNPSVPLCPHVHVYFALSCEQMIKIRDQVKIECGIEVFKMVRKTVEFTWEEESKESSATQEIHKQAFSYHEWKIGTWNMEIPLEKFVEGYHALAKKVYELVDKDSSHFFNISRRALSQ